ncbi:MAG TPA: BtrH N-terminal domain-containing protein [Bacteroidales bacterium]|nr:BtrH N-terminal domain-containing protein [Bacteroidales bacterium]
MKLNFEHIPSGHCENGVISGLLKYHGLNLNEALIFGIGSGLFFAHMPFIKMDNIAATSFRTIPGMIFAKATRRMGIKMKKQTFRKQPKRAMDELDNVLNKGLPVGVQAGAFHLSYFPPAYRFHFNAHNLTVYGKEGDTYFISDPVIEYPTTLTYDELKKVRYAKGAFPPNGKMYYPISIPKEIDFKLAIKKGIKQTTKYMLGIPVPLFGVKGIRYLARNIKKWPKKLGPKKASSHLAQVVRMMEEIGTGGAGFRFIYAAFLQEVAKIMENDDYNKLSKEMTDIGDMWRDFSSMAAKICKGRSADKDGYNTVANLLLDIADREQQLFIKLKELIKHAK